jgi:copper chaperone CopZ
MVIEGELEDIGVKSKCDFVKQAAEVEYDPDVISDRKITQTIEKQGYKVII